MTRVCPSSALACWGAQGLRPDSPSPSSLLSQQLSHGAPPASLSYHHPAFAPGPREELDYPGAADPDRLREGEEDALDVLLEDEGLGSRRSPPASPRGGSPGQGWGQGLSTRFSRGGGVDAVFFHRFPEDAGYSRGGGEQPGAEGRRRGGQLGTGSSPPPSTPRHPPVPQGDTGGRIQPGGLGWAPGGCFWGAAIPMGALWGWGGVSGHPLPLTWGVGAPFWDRCVSPPSSLFIYFIVLGWEEVAGRALVSLTEGTAVTPLGWGGWGGLSLSLPQLGPPSPVLGGLSQAGGDRDRTGVCDRSGGSPRFNCKKTKKEEKRKEKKKKENN